LDTAENLDAFFSNDSQFLQGLVDLRKLLNNSIIEEDYKWDFPTYTLDGKNIVALGYFKNHFGIWFFQGVFLKDTHNLLRNAQEDKTKAIRALNYTNIDQIDEVIFLEYLAEAIENAVLGKELKLSRSPKVVAIPEELLHAFAKTGGLKTAFEALTPGKQREYCGHIGSAKQEATRLRRLEKCTPMILEGLGLNHKYQ
jgi:uncharacterized protein YdeI (YjbR/CyaY-like superfamily)